MEGSNNWSEADRLFMAHALELATRSGADGQPEVPVGAVLVLDNEIVGEGWNRPIGTSDPTSHAEMEAIRRAAARLANYRLPGSVLYVTLEPCVMCAGAIVLSRLDRLVFAARDLRFGAVRSKFQLADSTLLNHRTTVQEGLFAAEAGRILADFFDARRRPRENEKKAECEHSA
jgi:tRNA(Arg) A34 adenosine deaminase TadA